MLFLLPFRKGDEIFMGICTFFMSVALKYVNVRNALLIYFSEHERRFESTRSEMIYSVRTEAMLLMDTWAPTTDEWCYLLYFVLISLHKHFYFDDIYDTWNIKSIFLPPFAPLRGCSHVTTARVGERYLPARLWGWNKPLRYENIASPANVSQASGEQAALLKLVESNAGYDESLEDSRALEVSFDFDFAFAFALRFVFLAFAYQQALRVEKLIQLSGADLLFWNFFLHEFLIHLWSICELFFNEFVWFLASSKAIVRYWRLWLTKGTHSL